MALTRALSFGVLAAVALHPAAPDPEPPMRFEIELPEQVDFSNTGRRVVAISPDGTRYRPGSGTCRLRYDALRVRFR